MNNITRQYNEWLLKQDITSMSNRVMGTGTLTQKFGSVYLSPRPEVKGCK